MYHGRSIPVQSLWSGQSEEIIELLGFMVSPAAKWMTGTSVRMDGGEIKGI
ncbi:MAG TPA: hypothetical protein VL495_08755 [Edaphobacter sp.]|jgi:3-oxoacyl-[acyl-carrier protein] reductase|nr:hypothetical protein [Edaphobacter sp.]